MHFSIAIGPRLSGWPLPTMLAAKSGRANDAQGGRAGDLLHRTAASVAEGPRRRRSSRTRPDDFLKFRKEGGEVTISQAMKVTKWSTSIGDSERERAKRGADQH
jgi:hypothetical protein